MHRIHIHLLKPSGVLRVRVRVRVIPRGRPACIEMKFMGFLTGSWYSLSRVVEER